MKKCCEEQFSSPAENISGGISPMSDTITRNLSNMPSHQELLLKIITELEEKNQLLMENNQLLRFKISTLESEIHVRNAKIDDLSKKLNININNTVPGEPSAIKGYPAVSLKPVTGAVTDAPGNSETYSNTILKDAATSDAPKCSTADSLNESSKDKLVPMTEKRTENPRIPRANDGRLMSLDNGENEKWRVVSRRRSARKSNKTLVVGSCSGDTSVEGIEKMKVFHVSNLKPDTTADELRDFLKSKFSSVKCERLTSKYPESYSSFKVCIPSSEYDKALDGSNWPNRASVHRFFQQRKIVANPAD